MLERAKSNIRARAIDQCRERLATRENFIAALERYKCHINTVEFRFTPVNLAVSRAIERAKGPLMERIGAVFGRIPLKRFDEGAQVRDWQQNPRYKITQLLDHIITVLREEPFDGIGNKIADCINKFSKENMESGVDFYGFLEQIGFVALVKEFHFMETIELQSTPRIILAVIKESAMSTIDGLIEKGVGEPALS